MWQKCDHWKIKLWKITDFKHMMKNMWCNLFTFLNHFSLSFSEPEFCHQLSQSKPFKIFFFSKIWLVSNYFMMLLKIVIGTNRNWRNCCSLYVFNNEGVFLLYVGQNCSVSDNGLYVFNNQGVFLLYVGQNCSVSDNGSTHPSVSTPFFA